MAKAVQDTVIISGEPQILTSNMEDVDSPEIFVKFTEARPSSSLQSPSGPGVPS